MAIFEGLSRLAFWKRPARYAERFCESADGLKLYYRDYRGPGGPTPLLCIPGLTRNARDFDAAAERLSQGRRVLVTDLRGRGKSEYAKDTRHYNVAVEAADVMRLLDDARISSAILLGTSRGGIVAMAIAGARPEAVKAVILNDIGAEIEARGLARILEFIGREPPNADWNAAIDGLRRAYGAAFPTLLPAQWAAFARALYRQEGNRVVPDYDPRLGDAVRQATPNLSASGPNVPLWPLFGALRTIPTLVLRGQNSDLLSETTVIKMRGVKPDIVSAVVTNRGHVPFLDEVDAVAPIDNFLARIP